jgi:hypothetical protein
MVGSYYCRMVALSILIAIMAAFATLALAARVTVARGKARPGWLGMNEPAALLGGEVVFQACPGHGTTVTARLPPDSDLSVVRRML